LRSCFSLWPVSELALENASANLSWARFAVGLCLTSTLFLLNACSEKQDYMRLSGPTMGTSYSVLYVVDDNHPFDNKKKSAALKEQIDVLLENIEQTMSTYRADSELSMINQAPAGTWLPISEALYQVLEKAQAIAQLSQGAFDITVAPLVNQWGFGPDFLLDKRPSEAQINQTLKDNIGYQFLQLNSERSQLKKHKPLTLDLSAIAKGYAVDRVAQHLLDKGINSFLVEIGGELKASGKKSNAKPWRVAIEQPIFDTLAKKREIASVVDLKSLAIASSGDYRNFFKDNGKIYSHTINPLTGSPVEHLLSSVTVLHTHAMDADALATAFMVMGPEKSLDYAEQHKLPILLLVRESGLPSNDKTEIKTKRLISSSMKPFLSHVD